jgi:threonine dehydratase
MSEVPPFNHPWTINGQGTLALELIEQVPDLDAILVAVGGCGLMSGVITVAKSSARNVQVFGAEPLAFDDTKASLAEDRRRGPTDPSATSICDALRVSPPGEICWDIIRGKCSGVFTAGDSATIRAMQMLMTDLKQVTEPSGAIATAVLFSDDFVNMLNADDRIKRIAVVICGANIGLDVLKRYT